jgi:hypothetical protein
VCLFLYTCIASVFFTIVLIIGFVYDPLFWWSSITECSHGYYGFNCNESCDGCLSDSCDKEHGVCTDT